MTRRVDGYVAELKPGSYVMFWGDPDIERSGDKGDRLLVLPGGKGEVVVVHFADLDVVYGCITWQVGEFETLTDPLRVLADIHNGHPGKRVSRAGMKYYGARQVCPACGLGRKNFAEFDDGTSQCYYEDGCGWRGKTELTLDPGW